MAAARANVVGIGRIPGRILRGTVGRAPPRSGKRAPLSCLVGLRGVPPRRTARRARRAVAVTMRRLAQGSDAERLTLGPVITRLWPCPETRSARAH